MFEVLDLEVDRGSTRVVNKVNLRISPGEILGLLGPNGAGKTTTIHAILGLLPCQASTFLLHGKPFNERTAGRADLIGYVPQSMALYTDLTVLENLRIWSGYYGLSSEKAEAAIEYSLGLSNLGAKQHDRVKTLSGGMQRRLNLAIGLLHSPQLLICDEPTTGVDANSRYAIYDALRRFRDSGGMVLYTTHYFQEVDDLCDRAVVMVDGTVREVFTLHEGECESADGVGAQEWAFTLDGAIPVAQMEELLRNAGIEASGVRLTRTSMESRYLSVLKARESENS